MSRVTGPGGVYMERINKLEAEVKKLRNGLMVTEQMTQQQEMVLTYMGCLFVQTELVYL
jgi:hypothetical protein